MQFIYDHLSAAIIGAIILLMLVAVQQYGREATVDSTLSYSVKKQMISAGELMDQDFQNLGAGVTDTLDVITEFTASRFSFRRRLQPGQPLMIVTYERVPYDTVEVKTQAHEDTTVVLYEVRRYQNTGAGPVLSGGAGARIVSWEIGLFDAAGVQILTTDTAFRRKQARRVLISASAWVPASNRIFRRMTWASEFQPPSLALSKLL